MTIALIGIIAGQCLLFDAITTSDPVRRLRRRFFGLALITVSGGEIAGVIVGIALAG